MSKVSNLNYNNVSVKTDSMVKMVRELSKLGVFKKKASKRRTKSGDEQPIRQSSDMVGFTKTIPNIVNIPMGASQNQIEDIQRRNDAVIAALREEVQQQRLEDIETVGQAFQHFRGSSPSQINPFKQTATAIQLPDVQEERFTETLNPGGPEAVEEKSTEVFAEEEGEAAFPTGGLAFSDIEGQAPLTGGESRISPVGRIRGAPSVMRRAAAAASYELPRPPPIKGTNRPDMEAYLRRLTDSSGYELDESVLSSKEKIFAEINRILDEIAKTL